MKIYESSLHIIHELYEEALKFHELYEVKREDGGLFMKIREDIGFLGSYL